MTDAWDQMALNADSEPGEFDREAFEASLRKSRDALERTAVRAFQSIDDDFARTRAARAREALTRSRPSGGWEKLVARSWAAQEPTVSERVEYLEHVDPDDVAHENSALDTPDAQTLR